MINVTPSGYSAPRVCSCIQNKGVCRPFGLLTQWGQGAGQSVGGQECRDPSHLRDLRGRKGLQAGDQLVQTAAPAQPRRAGGGVGGTRSSVDRGRPWEMPGVGARSAANRHVDRGEGLALHCGDARPSGVFTGWHVTGVTLGHSGCCGENRLNGEVICAEAELRGLPQCHRGEGYSVLTCGRTSGVC